MAVPRRTRVSGDVIAQYGSIRSTTAYMAATWQLDAAARWLVNVDLGATRPPGQTMRWKRRAGVEFAASASSPAGRGPRTARTTRSFQAGVRVPFGNKSIDLVAGRGLGQQTDHWINIGLNLAF